MSVGVESFPSGPVGRQPGAHYGQPLSAVAPVSSIRTELTFDGINPALLRVNEARKSETHWLNVFTRPDFFPGACMAPHSLEMWGHGAVSDRYTQLVNAKLAAAKLPPLGDQDDLALKKSVVGGWYRWERDRMCFVLRADRPPGQLVVALQILERAGVDPNEVLFERSGSNACIAQIGRLHQELVYHFRSAKEVFQFITQNRQSLDAGGSVVLWYCPSRGERYFTPDTIERLAMAASSRQTFLETLGALVTRQVPTVTSRSGQGEVKYDVRPLLVVPDEKTPITLYRQNVGNSHPLVTELAAIYEIACAIPPQEWTARQRAVQDLLLRYTDRYREMMAPEMRREDLHDQRWCRLMGLVLRGESELVEHTDAATGLPPTLDYLPGGFIGFDGSDGFRHYGGEWIPREMLPVFPGHKSFGHWSSGHWHHIEGGYYQFDQSQGPHYWDQKQIVYVDTYADPYHVERRELKFLPDADPHAKALLSLLFHLHPDASAFTAARLRDPLTSRSDAEQEISFHKLNRLVLFGFADDRCYVVRKFTQGVDYWEHEQHCDPVTAKKKRREAYSFVRLQRKALQWLGVPVAPSCLVTLPVNTGSEGEKGNEFLFRRFRKGIPLGKYQPVSEPDALDVAEFAGTWAARSLVARYKLEGYDWCDQILQPARSKFPRRIIVTDTTGAFSVESSKRRYREDLPSYALQHAKFLEAVEDRFGAQAAARASERFHEHFSKELHALRLRFSSRAVREHTRMRIEVLQSRLGDEVGPELDFAKAFRRATAQVVSCDPDAVVYRLERETRRFRRFLKNITRGLLHAEERVAVRESAALLGSESLLRGSEAFKILRASFERNAARLAEQSAQDRSRTLRALHAVVWLRSRNIPLSPVVRFAEQCAATTVLGSVRSDLALPKAAELFASGLSQELHRQGIAKCDVPAGPLRALFQGLWADPDLFIRHRDLLLEGLHVPSPESGRGGRRSPGPQEGSCP